jgi:hypothetical protein
MALSDLLNDTAALLNDQNFSFTSKNQLTRWVNEARRQAAYRTKCVRRLITGQSPFGASSQPGFAVPGAMQPGMIPQPVSPTGGQPVPGAIQGKLMTIPGVERYPYIGFFNPVLQATYAGCDQVFDALDLSVNWGGVSRPTIDWRPWDEFQAYCRAYAVLNTSYPAVWSVFNDGPQGEIWMFPIPSEPGEIELDAVVTPKPIYTDNDYEVIPDGFYNAIKYGAASLAFLASLRYANAQIMENMFADRLGVGRVAVDGGKTPSYYDTRL